jgi:NhaP-type Na+/H+ or K+/H+ antiporter
MQPAKRANFMKGVALGAAIIAFTTAASTITESKPVNFSDLGWWIDTLVQMAMAGIFVGAGASWLGRKKSS